MVRCICYDIYSVLPSFGVNWMRINEKKRTNPEGNELEQ